jgi:hypothetical protein
VLRAIRFLGAAIALGGLALQFWLMTKYPSSRGMGHTIIHFLSFFTVQTNILIAACLLLPALTPMSRVSQLLSRPSQRTAVMSYSALVAIIYFLVLRNIGHDYGLERLADWILHYVTPTVFLIDWVAGVPKGRIPWSAVARYLIYPALYAAWMLIYGAITGWYPYPFVNAARLGYAQLLGNLVALACVVISIPVMFLGIDRLLAALHEREHGT